MTIKYPNCGEEIYRYAYTCPRYGAENAKKMSVVTKAVNAWMFGILGNRRKKQFHCNNCGYEW